VVASTEEEGQLRLENKIIRKERDEAISQKYFLLQEMKRFTVSSE
jgi:hypothetical protein